MTWSFAFQSFFRCKKLRLCPFLKALVGLGTFPPKLLDFASEDSTVENRQEA